MDDKIGKVSIPEEKGEIIKILVENKAYPVCSNSGKIFFIKSKKSDFFDRGKDEIIKRLGLETEEDCIKVREIVKSDLEKQRTTKPIKEWFKDERPREMLIKQGAENLNSAKLLAIILRTGSEGVSAEELARRLLNHFGSLRAIDSASISDLQEINGIGMAKAAQIKASLEIGKRFMREETERKSRIKSVDDVVNFYKPYLRDLKEELFKIMLLDGRNKFIKDVTISKGSLTESVVHPREVIKEATKESAAAIILVHNHPSGESEPTKDDIEITNRLVKACELVGIRVLDHIIIGNDNYTSFVDKGLIKED